MLATHVSPHVAMIRRGKQQITRLLNTIYVFNFYRIWQGMSITVMGKVKKIVRGSGNCIRTLKHVLENGMSVCRVDGQR